MLKALFNQGYSRKFLDRIEFRRKEYFENRRLQTIRENATKMAYNWTHEYPTGTPISYIRDDIIESWERAAKKGIYKNLDKKQNIPMPADPMTVPSAVQLQWTAVHASPSNDNARGTRKDPAAQATIKKYKHEWRNPPDEDSPAEYKIEGPNEN